MSRSAPRQRGMVLIVTLAMLVVITLFVISMIRLGNTNAVIVGNMQAQKGVESEAQQAIEMALNKFQFFDDTIQETHSWAASSTEYLTYSALWTAYTPTGAITVPATQSDDIKIYRPQCLFFEPASGYSALSGIAPQDTYWDMSVKANDSKTAEFLTVSNGII